MRTDELIVQLAHAAIPVQPIASPYVRLARWIAVVVPLTVLGVVVIHPRADLVAAVQDPKFVLRAFATIATAILSAASAFVLSVPGVERSRLQRALPLLTGGLWALVLTLFLVEGGSAVSRLGALPFNPPCLYQIVGLSLLPGVGLFVMLRRAAPLEVGWSAILAALAAVALGAAGTQIICPVDDPAHQLVGHLLPVALLTLTGAVIGRRSLDWLRRD